jgi:hypothetical protein
MNAWTPCGSIASLTKRRSSARLRCWKGADWCSKPGPVSSRSSSAWVTNRSRPPNAMSASSSICRTRRATILGSACQASRAVDHGRLRRRLVSSGRSCLSPIVPPARSGVTATHEGIAVVDASNHSACDGQTARALSVARFLPGSALSHSDQLLRWLVKSRRGSLYVSLALRVWTPRTSGSRPSLSRYQSTARSAFPARYASRSERHASR